MITNNDVEANSLVGIGLECGTASSNAVWKQWCIR
jgi:hypothetical protein